MKQNLIVMDRAFRLVGWMLMLTMLVTGQLACQSQPRASGPAAATPAWVARVGDARVPGTVPARGSAALTGPTLAPEAGTALRGRSRLLTHRLEESGSVPGSAAAEAREIESPGGGAHQAGMPIANASVVVQVGPQGGKDDTKPMPGPERSTLERLYLGEFSRDANRQLSQFGYDYFDRRGEAGAGIIAGQAVDEIGPVTDDYMLGAGDELKLEIWGSFAASHTVMVDRDGVLVVPEIGAVMVAGLSVSQAVETVRRAVEVQRKDFELSLSVARLRRMGVHVVGEVARPGLVEVPARATLITALIAAGGPTRSASLRRVRLDQDGQVHEIDLYSFLMEGDRSPLALLRSGAVITVLPIGPTAAVAGLVHRPGIYELRGGSTVKEMLAYAGGLTAFTFTPQAQIERTVEGRGRQKFDCSITGDGLGMVVGDGELLLIGAVDTTLAPSVGIVGEVVRPGSYEHRAGMRIADLVARADGLTIDAYLPQALVSRQIGPAGEVEQVPGRMSVGSSRRVMVIDLGKAMAGDPAHNIELMVLDQVEIRSVAQSLPQPTVTILGAVNKPGKYELTSGLTVSALVAMAGNLASDVYFDEAELIRRVYDESTRSLDVKRFRFDLGTALQAGGQDDPVLANGDQVVIRSLRAEQVTVRVEGEVRFAGVYVFPAGARITDMIAAAGGVTDAADMRAAAFLRKSAEQTERDKLRHLAEQTRRVYESALEHLVKDGASKEGLAGKLALMQTQELIRRMESTQVQGRIVIPFTRDDFPASASNLTLEDGDRLVVPRRRETVGVVGMVFNPSNFVAESGTTVRSVLDRAGGLAEEADEKRIYLIRADGSVESLAQRGGHRLSMSTPVLAGDVVLVPRRPLERSFGAQLGDVLALARQAAEVGLLTSQISRASGQADVTAVLPGPVPENRVLDYSDTILTPRR